MEAYGLLSDPLSIFSELLLNVCPTFIKLFIILACIITTHIELSILVVSVIYALQFSSSVALMLVEELLKL